jgi:hypothetical protein
MKGRKARATGGTDDTPEDMKPTPERTPNAKTEPEAEEKKHGGRAKRKHGGKSEMKVEGHKGMMHAGRKPRKSGGRSGSDSSPLTSSHSGKQPPGRSVMSESMD